MNAIAGKDFRDATSLDRAWGDFAGELNKGVKGLKIALPKQYFGEGISPEVKGAVLEAAKRYEALGAFVEEADLPALEYALPAYYVISSAEASSNLARFDGVKYGFRAEDYEDIDQLYLATRTQGFGKEVKRRIMLGSFVLSAGYYDAYYKKALQVRTLIQREFDRALEGRDLILAPVAPTTAYRIGEKNVGPLTDVFRRRVHRAGKHCRAAGSFSALRRGPGRPAGGDAAHRKSLQRGFALPGRICL